MKLAGGIVLFLALGAGAFFGGYFISSFMVPSADERPTFSNYVPEPAPQAAPAAEEAKAPAVAAATTTPAQATSSAPVPSTSTAAASAKISEIFISNLSSCTKYKTETQEILGFIGERCGYFEYKEGKKSLECAYSESERKAIADYYRDLSDAKELGIALSGTKKYKIEEKEVTNPLEEVIANESCAIL